MESYEVLRNALQKTTPKAVAAELGVSLSLVYKWAEKPSDLSSGSKNPLDRVQQIIELSEDNGILDWLCLQQGGHFVKDSEVSEATIDHIVPATQQIISHFSELLNQISMAAVDRVVTKDESDDIRQVWDRLKSYGEGFVRACEKGDFREGGKASKNS